MIIYDEIGRIKTDSIKEKDILSAIEKYARTLQALLQAKVKEWIAEFEESKKKR